MKKTLNSPTPLGMSLSYRLLVLISCFPVFLFSCLASAVTPAVAVRPDLSSEPIQIVSLSPGELIYFDSQRVQRRVPTRTFLQLRAIGNAEESTAEAGFIVELVDGQRLTGTWDEQQNTLEHIVWEHPLFGRAVIPYDRLYEVRSVDTPSLSRTAAGAAITDDMVLLDNGDRMVGFIESIDAESVKITPTGMDAPVSLPRQRVVGMRVVNPLTPRGPGHMVVFTDGSRVLAKSVAMGSQQVVLSGTLFDAGAADAADSAAAELTVDLAHVARIDFGSAGLTLRDLQDFDLQVVRGGSAFGVAMPPRRLIDGLTLHAPVVVRFELPKTARRFAATATLDLPDNLTQNRRRWAGFDLVVRHGPAAEQRVTLDADHPSAELNLPIEGGVLELELDPAVGGAILDRLRLDHPLILLERAD